MSLRRNKWLQRHKPIVYKFEEQAEETRKQNAEYWDLLLLPKRKPTNRKPKPCKPKGSRRTIKEKLKAIAYRQAEERDEGMCVVCGGQANEHHHVIKQSTRYRPEYIQRMENVAMVCMLCHGDIHNPSKGKSDKQEYLEQWQQRNYPEYSAMMRELAKITGCRDEWLIQRWLTQQYGNNTAIGG